MVGKTFGVIPTLLTSWWRWGRVSSGPVVPCAERPSSGGCRAATQSVYRTPWAAAGWIPFGLAAGSICSNHSFLTMWAMPALVNAVPNAMRALRLDLDYSSCSSPSGLGVGGWSDRDSAQERVGENIAGCVDVGQFDAGNVGHRRTHEHVHYDGTHELLGEKR
jgi:hypothetical protein